MIMMINNLPVFLTAFDTLHLKRFIKVSNSTNYVDWLLETYITFKEYVNSKLEHLDVLYYTELLYKMECDILNHNNAGYVVAEPVYTTKRGFRVKIWKDVMSFNSKIEYGYIGKFKNIQEYFDSIYDERKQFNIFDVVKIKHSKDENYIGRRVLIINVSDEANDDHVMEVLYNVRQYDNHDNYIGGYVNNEQLEKDSTNDVG